MGILTLFVIVAIILLAFSSADALIDVLREAARFVLGLMAVGTLVVVVFIFLLVIRA